MNPGRRPPNSGIGEEKQKIQNFVSNQLKLLETELLAVTKQERQEHAELGEEVGVEVVDIKKTKYGGLILQLKQRKERQKTPNFKVGENIGLLEDPGEYSDPFGGIIKKVFLKTYEVAVSESPEIFNEKRKWILMKVSDNSSFKWMEAALEKIPENNSPLRDVLLGLTNPSSNSVLNNNNHTPISYQNKALDDSQKRAVEFALKQKEIGVVHGPPGTGKTTTLVEIVHQSVRRGEKVLVTAASHVAVDNIAERLARAGLNILRIGHPARVTSDSVLEHTLDVRVGQQLDILEKIKFEYEVVIQKLHSGRMRRLDPTLDDQKNKLKRKLNKEQAKLKKMKETQILGADVVLGTLIGCGSQLEFLDKSPGQHFQLVIIDECGQSMEMACWVVIHRAPRLILAGDHQQLPPTVISKSEAVSSELSKSLMERFFELYYYKTGAVMLQVR